MRVWVTGAAGYIGSVVTEELIEKGHEVLAFDNLRHGTRAAVHPAAQFFKGDLLDREELQLLMRQNPADAVVHMAAEALIDESVRDPGRFFRVNICGGINLLDAMVAADVKKMVFSSTAAVYGEPESIPITEAATCVPVNSYGESKLAFEKILAWYSRAHGLQCISLRYFNACGATKRCGEFHVPETHLIPNLFEVALGQREVMRVNGTDYDTPDGTCIRDYIHVTDIAQAHVRGLEKVDHLGTRAYNMGNGAGYSNREVIEAVSRVTGRKIKVVPGDRRPGDPARLVASSERIRQELRWAPQYVDLETMVETAWAWRLEHPQGYAA